jgi:hypothetical protein
MDDAIVAAFAAALSEPDMVVTEVTTLAERGRDLVVTALAMRS